MLRAYKITYHSYTTNVRSYTLFGLFCWAYLLYKGENKLINFLTEFTQNPLFIISSPFPIINNILFLPKPVEFKLTNTTNTTNINYKIDQKKSKKIELISINLFLKTIKPNPKFEYLIYNNLLITPEEQKIIKDYLQDYLSNKNYKENIIIARNLINRINLTSENLYFEEGYLKFYDEYFLVYFYDKNFINEFEHIMFNIASFLGLGKNKSIGWGKISITPLDPTASNKINLFNDLIKNFQNSKTFLTLSPIILNPKSINYIDFDNTFYELETYKSYTESIYNQPIMKNKVIYLKEGSIITTQNNYFQNYLNNNNKEFIGQLKEVGNNIKQYGLEFPIPFNFLFN